jgi:DNA-binding IscR family transcriptional regulator
MYEVIQAIDGPICLNLCLVSGKSCARKAHCPAHPVWERAQRAMLDVLTGTAIAELASQASVCEARAVGAVSPFGVVRVMGS